MYRISCCSTADLKEQYLKERGIPYLPFHFQMDGKEYLDDLGHSISPKEFYERIDEGAMPVTSQCNTEEYKDFFTPMLEEGNDILHICLSSGISGTYNSARIAKEELEEQFPERKIYIIDSLGASSGYGMLVDALYENRERGMSIDENAKWAEEQKLHIHHWFFSNDLTHFKRGGRISPAAAAFGNVLNICPLLHVDQEGKLIPKKKVRGKKVIKEIVAMMELHATDGLSYSGKCFISHSARYEEAKQVAELVKATFPNLKGEVEINDIGAVIGAHTGPGTVALFFMGDSRKEEKAKES